MTQCGTNTIKETKKEVKKEVQKIENNTLVLFYASWCGHSQKMLSEFKTLMKDERVLSIKIIMLEVSEHQTTFEYYEVKSYPTMKFADKDGKIHDFNPKSRTYKDMLIALGEFNIKKQEVVKNKCGL
jgi:thiol-disulfide isomerase/thioredoxin